MLLSLREYHRPADEGTTGGLNRALELLSRPDVHTVPLAGGTALLASADPAVEAVVDLQGLGLDIITETGRPHGRLHIGALVTRAALAESEPARTRHDGILAAGACGWGGSVQRNRATVGGALALAAPNDPLVLALLVCDALVDLYGRRGTRVVPIADFLAHRGSWLAEPALITAVTVPFSAAPTGCALVDVARTPSDAPIVAAAAALSQANGRCATARLALGGVADAPARLPEVEAMLAGQTLTDELVSAAAALAADLVSPAGDFRGSAEYRTAMAGVLAERALRQAWQRAA
jgi:CO/xanthine dehydrogenase FAD-binding subunit